MPMTKMTNMVNPEVMADMISATLPKRIKFSPIAKIDTTLVARPGNTITVPKYAYIGDAEDVAEGVAIGTTVLTTSTTTATVKKSGKAVEITDEAVLSGYGQPMTEAAKQIAMSIAAKVDNDCYDVLCEATLVHDGSAAPIGYNPIVDANAKFEDEIDNALAKIMFIHPNQESTIRKDPNFMSKDKYPLEVVMNGTIGAIAGCQIVKSKKVKLVEYVIDQSAGTITITEQNLAQYAPKTLGTLKVNDKIKAVATKFYACPIVVVDAQDPNEDPTADDFATDQAAVTIYMKRNVLLETDRDILKRTNVIAADEHFVAVLSNESKVVLAKLGE